MKKLDYFTMKIYKRLINGASDDNVYKAEIERLQKIIGKQAIQIKILKKTEELFGKR